MENDCQIVATNQLDFRFDDVGFNLKFRLIKVETETPGKLPNWFDHCPVLAIQKLPRISKDTEQKKTVCYLVLMLKKLPIPVVDPGIRQKVMTLQQALEQEVTTDTIIFMMMKASTQCYLDDDGIMRNPKVSDRLLLVRSKPSKTGYLLALEVVIKNNVLKLISRTFVSREADRGYVILQDCLKWSGSKSSQMFVQKGLNGRKGVTEFFSLKDLDAFNQTKLGVMQELIERLAQFEDCFERIPSFHLSELNYFSDRVKITSGQRLIVQLTGKNINFVVNSRQSQTVKLGHYLQKRITKSLKCKSANITASITQNPIPGFNIQILLNTQDEAYLCGQEDTVIQHITFEKFGEVKANNEEYKWYLDDGDILDDKKIQMTLWQLLIKQDIENKEMQVPEKDELIACMPYRYFLFENLSGKHHDSVRIGVTELSIDKFGHPVFKTQMFCDDKVNETDELLKITRRVWEASNRSCSNLIGAIMYQDKLFLILNSELVTVPKIAQIKRFMVLSNGDNIISRSELLVSAKAVPCYTRKHEDIKNRLIDSISMIRKETLSIRQLQPYLDGYGLNWKNKVMQEFNNCFYRMHHKWIHSPARQKKYWLGTYGIGLITLNGENYYFVGRNLAIEMKQARAVPLKKIVAVDSNQPIKELIQIFQSFKQMMQVDFVKLNQYTVTPFPFKYLREYVDMEKHKSKVNDSKN